MFMMMQIYAVKKGFTRKSLDEKQIVILAFITSGFVYGISYILPFFFYAFLGLALAYMEQQPETHSFILESARRRKKKLQSLRSTKTSSNHTVTSY